MLARVREDATWVDTSAPRRSAAPRPPTSSHVLRLQRAAGNRATARVLARRLTIDPTTLPTKDEDKERRHLLEWIRKAALEYEGIGTAAGRVQSLDEMKVWIEGWISRARGVTDTKVETTRVAMNALLKDVIRELKETQHQADYMADLKGTGNDPFKYLSIYGPLAIGQAEGLAAGTVDTGTGGQTKSSLKRFQGSGLTDAEAAAIKLYSVADYRYINPALAKDAAWLQIGVNRQDMRLIPTDPAGFKRVEVEAGRHAEMIDTALAKLPLWTDWAFHGEVMDLARYTSEWKALEGKRKRLPYFFSMSKQRVVAQDWALGEGSKRTHIGAVQGNNAKVLVAVKPKRSFDISELTLKPEEQEVLLPAGAELDVRVITDTGEYFLVECHEV